MSNGGKYIALDKGLKRLNLRATTLWYRVSNNHYIYRKINRKEFKELNKLYIQCDNNKQSCIQFLQKAKTILAK